MFQHYPTLQKRHDEIAYDPLFCKTKHTGERMMEPIPFSSMITPDKDGKRPTTATHSRPKFHKILLEQVEGCGIDIEFGKEVVDYFEDAGRKRAGVVLKGGERVEADLVIAADGLRGQSWGLVAGEPVPARSSGSAVFRAAYPVELAVKDPMVAERFSLSNEGKSIFELWMGPGMFGTFWRNDTEMMWSITHPDEGTAEESWNHKVEPKTAVEYTSTVSGWPEVANRVIMATPADGLIDWKLMWRDPQPTWVSPGGYVVQLGDAAHTFLPSSGNGESLQHELTQKTFTNVTPQAPLKQSKTLLLSLHASLSPASKTSPTHAVSTTCSALSESHSCKPWESQDETRERARAANKKSNRCQATGYGAMIQRCTPRRISRRR